MPLDHPERDNISTIIVNFELLCAKIKEQKEGSRPSIDRPGGFVPYNFAKSRSEDLTTYFDRMLRKLQEDAFASDTLQRFHGSVSNLKVSHPYDSLEFGGLNNCFEDFRQHIYRSIDVTEDLSHYNKDILNQILIMLEEFGQKVKNYKSLMQRPGATRRRVLQALQIMYRDELL